MVTILVALDLTVTLVLIVWLLEGVVRTGIRYVRTGAVARGGARQMMLRGAAAVATWALWAALR